MAGYKQVTNKDVEIFLKLYKKYLLLKVKEMEEILKTLPTNVIERCFNSAEFYDKGFDTSKIDEIEFGFGGLHGFAVKLSGDKFSYHISPKKLAEYIGDCR